MKKKDRKKPKKNEKKTPSKDYIFWALLTIIIISGLYFRVTNYAQEGIKNDGPTTLTAGLLWYYPHDFYPGLMVYHAPVAHYIIAGGCMLSGEDFSNVSKARPYFVPNLAQLIGKQYAAAENYCFIPVYLSSILVFLGYIIFSLMLLNRRESLYAIAFFAYSPTILSLGRNLYAWTFVWLFSLYGLIFLWLFYNSKKGTKEEAIYAIIMAAIFGIAFAAKFTLGFYSIFPILIILEKYKENFNFSKGNAKVPLPLIKSLLIFIVVYTITTLIPYQLNPGNLIDVISTEARASGNTTTSASIGLGTINAIKSLLINMNPIDSLIILYSAFILYSLFRKKQKDPKEKLIYYTALLFIFSTTLFSAQLGGTRSIPYFLTIPLLMALAFSDKDYSIFQKLKINNERKRTQITYTIIALYITLSIYTLYPTTPYYITRMNKLYCMIEHEECSNFLPWPSNKLVNHETSKFLKDNETFYDPTKLTGETYFYLRNEDFYNIWLLETYIQREYKVTPNIYDIIRNYNFNNRKIQYLVLHPGTRSEEEKSIIKAIQPFKTIKINNIPVAYIYNVDSLPNIHGT